MPQERTGQWHVWQQGQWIPATPPGMAAPPPPVPAAPTAAYAQPAAAGSRQAGGGGSKVGKYIAIWLVFWVLVAVAVLIFAKEPAILAGVGLAALISLVLMLSSMSSHWQGQVVDIRLERERVRNGDDWDWEQVTFAYIREPSGKTRKMRAMPGWQVGDRLVKRKGEMDIRKL